MAKTASATGPEERRRASSACHVVRASAAVFLLGSALATPAGGEPPVTGAPAVHFGDEWRYSDGVVSRVWLDPEGRPQLQLGRGIPPMDFPLFVGKRWTATYHHGAVQTLEATSLRVDIVDLVHEHVFDVVGFEEVTTPVGTLDAYRIRWIQYTVGPERSAATSTIWYSPGVGAVVKRRALTPAPSPADLDLQEYRPAGRRWR